MNYLLRSVKSGICWGVVVCFLFVGSTSESFSQEGTNDGKEYHITKTDEKKKPEEDFDPNYPEETKSSSTSNQLMILGGAVALGVGALAIAGGGGGGSDEPACELDPVGPNIAGDWSGRLRLVNHGSQDVTASVTQCGSQLTITTDTALPYGKVFTGSINRSGNILVYDSITNEDWTTKKGSASSTSLRLYDYVNNFTALDSLELGR